MTDELTMERLTPTNQNFENQAVKLATAALVDGVAASLEPYWTNATNLVAALVMWEGMNTARANARPSRLNVRAMLDEPYGVEDGKPVGLLRTLIEMYQSGFEPITTRVKPLLQPTPDAEIAISTARSFARFDSPGDLTGRTGQDAKRGAYN
jgi:hypothetical protein